MRYPERNVSAAYGTNKDYRQRFAERFAAGMKKRVAARAEEAKRAEEARSNRYRKLQRRPATASD